MSIEQRKEFMDVLKVLMWVAISLSGFFAANKLTLIDHKLEKLDTIEMRVIRMEYELKLK